MIKTILSIPVILAAIMPAIVSVRSDETPQRNQGQNVTELLAVSSKQLNANNISTWFRNNGSFNRDPATGNSGFRWPKTGLNFARYASGLWLGAKVGNDTLIAIAEYNYEYRPGFINNNGIAEGENDPGYRIYLIEKGNTASDDYRRWPDYQGAYTDNSGLPLQMGDQTMFYSYTDGYHEYHINNGGATMPLKAHILQTNWCSKGSNPFSVMGNTVFTEFRIINRSGQLWRDLYIGIWTDDDLGSATDDAVGSDSLNQFSFTCNFDNSDPDYGTAPPAVGFIVLRGPLVPSANDTAAYYDPPTSGNLRSFPGKKLQYSSSMILISEDWQFNDPNNYSMTYKLLQGRSRYDSLIMNPVTGLRTRYHYSGDPESNTGWNMVSGNDRRSLTSLGPVDLQPNDTQKIVIAQLIARGTNNQNSITLLRKNAVSIRRNFEADLISKMPVPPGPQAAGKTDGKGSALISIAVNDSVDSIRNLFSAGTYKFQGYNIYQIRNYSFYPNQQDTVKVKTFDVKDNIGNIYDSIYLPEYNTVAFALVQSGDNSGILSTFRLERDTFTSLPFKDGYEYKFAVSAYYYDPQGGLQYFPKVMHSRKSVFTFTAQPSAIGTVTPYSYGYLIPTDQRDPGVLPFIADAFKLPTANYVSTIYSKKELPDILLWNVIRNSNGAKDTLLKDRELMLDSMTEAASFDGIIHYQYMQKDSGVARDVIQLSHPFPMDADYSAWSYSPEGGEWFTGPDTLAIKTAKIITGRQFQSRSLGMSFPTNGTFRNNRTQISANASYLSQISAGNRILTGGPLRKIRIRFGESNRSMAYRYVPQDTALINCPCAGLAEIPFSVFMADELDSTGGALRQVNVGFLDADASGTWNPKGGDDNDFQRLGGYEFTYIFASVYDEQPLPEYLSRNPGIANPVTGFPSLDVMYAWLPRAKSINGQLMKWGEGDELIVWPLRITKDNFVPGFPVKYGYSVKKAETADVTAVQSELNKINIFPNPYYGFSELEYNSTGEKFIYISNLPVNAVIYIYSLDGVLVRKIVRNESAPDVSLEKWDLKNDDGAFVATGMYIMFVECPGIGAKTLKAAVMQNRF